MARKGRFGNRRYGGDGKARTCIQGVRVLVNLKGLRQRRMFNIWLWGVSRGYGLAGGSFRGWGEGCGRPIWSVHTQGDRPVDPTGGKGNVEGMDSGSKARMIRLWRTGSPMEGRGMAEGGRGKGEDEVCQRSLCGLGRDVGDHPRRNAAGIRFYADEGGAGNHPRQSAGIRFYAKEGGAGNHPR